MVHSSRGFDSNSAAECVGVEQLHAKTIKHEMQAQQLTCSVHVSCLSVPPISAAVPLFLLHFHMETCMHVLFCLPPPQPVCSLSITPKPSLVTVVCRWSDIHTRPPTAPSSSRPCPSTPTPHTTHPQASSSSISNSNSRQATQVVVVL